MIDRRTRVEVLVTGFMVFMLGSLSLPVRAEAQSGPQKLTLDEIKKLPGWSAYKKHCGDCHGEKGDGRGKMGKTMTPSPADYRTCDVLGALTDEDAARVILEGSEAVGKSKAMPGFKTKLKEPGAVEQVIEVMRSFAGCAPSEK
jgi:hypothetical protein